MERLEAEISALEELLNSKKQTYERAKAVRDAHLRTIAPIRRVPQDVLGVIFPYAVDIPPFNRYIDLARLRSICSSWRHLAKTMPGLWTLLHFEEVLAPWTSILSKTTPYRLDFKSDRTYPPDYPISHKNMLIQHLFHLTPGPGDVTVRSWSALSGALSSCCSSTRKVRVDAAGMRIPEEIRLEPVFPNLEILMSDCSFDCAYLSLGHPSLAILHMDDVQGSVTSFTHVLQVLPALRELKLNSSRTFGDPPNPREIYSHLCLEVLLVRGEDLLYLFRSLAFPALRFSIVEGLDMNTDSILADEILPRILGKSTSSTFIISLRGRLRRRFVEQIIGSLPANSYVHLTPSRILNREDPYDMTDGTINIESDNVEAIFCDTRTGDLSFLADSPARRHSSRPLNIHIPSNVGDAETNRQKWEALEGAGYHLDLRSAGEIDSTLLSLAPEYRPESPWEYYN
ncbi:hypothetical protein BKA70DRAFT_1341805 [Coprinopsis sp. MPI-PUGE-AT-0042]|nr:hypothetical protein BKA70DRAFT_1341805 [Coprinopsis sp. MPI-PUGE-AT-0042]